MDPISLTPVSEGRKPVQTAPVHGRGAIEERVGQREKEKRRKRQRTTREKGRRKKKGKEKKKRRGGRRIESRRGETV